MRDERREDEVRDEIMKGERIRWEDERIRGWEVREWEWEGKNKRMRDENVRMRVERMREGEARGEIEEDKITYTFLYI